MNESLNHSLIRIWTSGNDDGAVVGAGFLVGDRLVLTCAHVIAQALGFPANTLNAPQEVVWLDFPLLPQRTKRIEARVVQWQPELPDGGGDIAGLELSSNPPSDARRVHFVSAKAVWGHTFSAFGFPMGQDSGVWATGQLLDRQAIGWLIVEGVKAQGYSIERGFSGTPVWDTQAQGVVGMVVAASRPADIKAAFVIPTDVLFEAWPLIATAAEEPRNPYKGLHPFRKDDAGDFFGREQLVAELIETTKGLVSAQSSAPDKRLLTVIGSSGSGKSSVVMAGLLPELQNGALPGSEKWVYLDPIVPGKHPIEALVDRKS
ncbi:MAG: serine protease, partial [Ktedonobacteraceae bacterium]